MVHTLDSGRILLWFTDSAMDPIGSNPHPDVPCPHKLELVPDPALLVEFLKTISPHSQQEQKGLLSILASSAPGSMSG